VDYSSRHRYRVRRQQIAARRRRIAIIAGVAALVLAVGAFALRRPASAPATSPAAQATRAAAQATQTAGPAAQGSVPTAAAGLATPTPAPDTQADAAGAADQLTATPLAPAPFFDDRRLTYEPGFYVPQIQAFLDTQAGPLKRQQFQVGDGRYSFAEVLVGQTSYYSINPKVILALLEQRSALLSTPNPSPDQLGWALAYQGENGNKRGFQAQVRWAIKQMLLGKHDYPAYAPLTYADGSSAPPPAGMSLSEYVIARVLAPTSSPDRLPKLLQAFQQTYARLFGDPRQPPTDWPAPAAPFLAWPLAKPAPVTSFFDHGGPFLTRNAAAGITTYWGRNETDIAFAYNGHDGWDYAAAPPDMALAAAEGDVVFAGNADDNCATRAVIIDHGNGYRTLYWHLSRIDVELGQHVPRGEPIGMIGASGCANGPHLHFGVQYLGRNTDPYGWCGNTPDPWQQSPAGSQSTWLWLDRPSPCAPPPPDAVVVDAGGPGFAKEGDGWQSVPVGYGGEALFAPSLRGADAAGPLDLRPLARPAVAVWRPTLPHAGRYRVLVYVPYALSGLEDATRVRYRVRYSGGEAEVLIDEPKVANDWVDLGTYSFDPADNPTVSTSNIAEGGQLSVWADAVMWLPVE
jgi:murein DD-endopeptidase MepM/ murein hydrolase activator NlpD